MARAKRVNNGMNNFSFYLSFFACPGQDEETMIVTINLSNEPSLHCVPFSPKKEKAPIKKANLMREEIKKY